MLKKGVLSSTAILLINILSFFRSEAQLSIGFEAGLSDNYLITNISNLVSTKYIDKNGISLEVPLTYKVNDWFSLHTSLGFIQKNYQLQRTDYFEGIYQNKTNGYIQLPVSAQFYFGGKKFKGFVEMGGYVAEWLTSHIEGATPNALDNSPYSNTSSNQAPNTVSDEYTIYHYDEKYTLDSRKDNGTEFGVLGGLGLNYAYTKEINLLLHARIFESLTDQQNNYQINQVPRYNESYVFTFGVMYNIPSKQSMVSGSQKKTRLEFKRRRLL